MKTTDFLYELPEKLIAQTPVEKRDASRLLKINLTDSGINHLHFSDLPSLLKKGDRLVFNDTKVIPARLFVKKSNGVKIELLFTNRIDEKTWKIIAKPAKRLKVGAVVSLELDNSIKISVDKICEDGGRIVSYQSGESENIDDILEVYGTMPLPPYIEREASKADRGRYQTVYANQKGAIAAPTAGLHFTKDLISELQHRGVETSFLTLHVGIGTFRPVKTENILEHSMHSEEYDLSQKCVDEIERTRKNGGRIIAVGTTTVRVLEHCARAGSLKKGRGSTDIFIYPSWEFKIINGLVTNFHLPGSTLLMLVSAFAGKDKILNAYKIAVEEQYRFFSYGDSMLII